MPGTLPDLTPTTFTNWPKPNYDDPVTRTWLVPYACTLTGVMTIFVALRFWLRATKQAGSLGLDDGLLVPAWLGAIAFTGTISEGIYHHGFDRHVWDVRPVLFSSGALIGWLSSILFVFSTTCTKVSILLFFRRLTKGTYSLPWMYGTLGAVAFTSMAGISIIFASIFQCWPVASYWKVFSGNYGQEFSCVDSKILNLVSGILSVLTDTFAVVFPMGMLWHFNIPPRQKVAMNLLFSLGFLVVACGCVRTYYGWRLTVGLDSTWIGYTAYIWITTECQLALILANAPAIRVFYKKYLREHLSSAAHRAKSMLSSNERIPESIEPKSDTPPQLWRPRGDMNEKGQGDFLTIAGLDSYDGDELELTRTLPTPSEGSGNNTATDHLEIKPVESWRA